MACNMKRSCNGLRRSSIMALNLRFTGDAGLHPFRKTILSVCQCQFAIFYASFFIGLT